MNQIAQSSSKICLRRLVLDYRIACTSTRFRSRTPQQRVKQPAISPYLSSGTYTIQKIKQPSGKYLGLKLSDADAKLIESNDFIGVKSLNEKGYLKLSPENVFSQIMEYLKRNQRVHAEFFMVNILLQLEQKNPNLRAMISKKPDFYVPLLIQCCGHSMSDLHKKNREKLLDRLVEALNLNKIPLGMPFMNALLTTKMENDTDFDAKEILNELDHKWKLQPDIKFFNCLFWQLAKTGKLNQFINLRNQCIQRGLLFDKQTSLAEIYLFEHRGITMKSDALIKRYSTLYGSEYMYEALGAACCGAARGRYTNRLRILLRQSLAHDEKLDAYFLKIPNKDVFDVLWLLAENSSDKMGKEWSTLSQQILELVVRNSGFFKKLYAETERHINHGYFYSAVITFQDMYRLRNSLEAQKKTRFVNQIFGYLANKLIVNGVNSDIIIEIGNRMIAFFGADVRFYDNILQAVLTYRHYPPMDKFEQFRKFIDLVDPTRERIHLILPLVTSCSDLTSRYKMLYRCSNLGYKNIADLDSYVVNDKIVKPFVDQTKNSRVSTNDWNCLQGLADSLKSYGIPLKDTWMLYFNLLKENQTKNLNLNVDTKTLKEWLKTKKDSCFPKENAQAEARKAALNYKLLHNFVTVAKNIEKVHEFLVYRGFPPDTDFDEIAEPLLYLYLESANWGYVQKLLQMLSRHNASAAQFDAPIEEKAQQIETNKHFIKNYHLLYVLRRKLDELPPEANFSIITEYAFELKRLFPTAIADQDNFFEAIKAYRSLFYVLTESSQGGRTLSINVVEQIIELLNVLVRLEIINLHANETLTPFIIGRILNAIGWNAAVETWMKFQTTFHCSNGILELFCFDIRHKNSSHIPFIVHKANMYLPSPKVTTFLAASYALLDQHDKAADVMAQANPSIDPWIVVPVFRLTNSLLNSYRKMLHSNFPLAFMKICLEHTNLAQDPKALQICHNDWIRMCGKDAAGSYAINFMDLFESHGIKLNINDLRPIQSTIMKHNFLVQKWITGSDGVLNLENLEGSPTMCQIERYETKLKEIEAEIANAPPSSSETQDEPNEQKITI